MTIFQPPSGDPGDSRASSPEHVGAPETEHRIIRDGRQVIASGSLACTECGLPFPGRPAVAVHQILGCGWCGHSAPARAFFRSSGGADAPASRVELVARLGS